MAVWYCGSVQHTAVTQFAISHAYSVGDFVRALAAPSVGNERVWRCTTAGTSGGSESAWTLTKGSTTNQGTAVFTEVTGNSTYGWSAAAARVDLFTTWAAAGDSIYTASNHAETRAAAMTAPAASITNPMILISVNPAGSVPPVAADYSAGASVTVTGSNTLTFGGTSSIWYGFNFTAGTSTDNASITIGPTGNNQTVSHEFFDCSFTLGGNSVAAKLNFGNNGNTSTARCRWVNCNAAFSSTSQGIFLRLGDFHWDGGSVNGSTFPTNLFTSQAMGQTMLFVEGVDFSSISGTVANQGVGHSRWTFANCKVHASATLASAASVYGGECDFINCDSSTANYKQTRRGYTGILTQESTIVRSSGASDGTTPISHKIVTNTNVTNHKVQPFRGFQSVIWNTATGSSKTVTMEFVTDNVTLKDDELWIEVEYLGSSASPKASRVSSAPATYLTASSNLSTSSATWTTTGLTTPVKQKASVSFTPQMVGLVKVTPYFAKASLTVYYDPKVTIS